MSNLFQSVGMFLCVGALIVIGLVVFAAAMRKRSAAPTTTNRPVYDEDDRVFNEQGTARPQYDDRDVQTAGGFGVPATGNSNPRPGSGGFGARNVGDDSNRQQQDDDGFMDLDDRLRNRDSGSTTEHPRRKRDDDDIRSSGGFGGS